MEHSLYAQLPRLQVELQALEALLADEFGNGNEIQRSAGALVLGGGKRLRPAMALSAAFCGNYDRCTALNAAAAMEVLHAATLAHDDVIDHAGTRRGAPTLHSLHGNHVAIYAGDYLLAKSMKLLSRSNLPSDRLGRVSSAIEALCMGEVGQYLGRGTVPGLREYLKRVMSKTGILFAAACAVGGQCAGLPEQDVQRLWHVGMRFGAAFQIRDDLLDIEHDGDTAGKPTGHDLMEGIVTLPVLLAAQDAAYRARLDGFLQGRRTARLASGLLRAARKAGAMGQAADMMCAQLDRAAQQLEKLPPSDGRHMLQAILRSVGAPMR